jgi:type I restriction enzyme S subunit
MSAWPIVPIKDYARVVGGATPKSGTAEYWDGDIPWTTPKDLSDLKGKYLTDTPRKITALGLKSCSSELLPPNSVLFSSRAPIGHVAINTVPMATNQGFKSFIPSPKLDASFLFWWLKCHRAQLELLGNGATFKEVSKAIVERIEIPLPPLDEQKLIAAILDQADELRRKRQRAIDRLNQLGQAIFSEMFADSDDFEFEIEALLSDGSLIVHKDGNHGSNYPRKEEFGDEGVPFLSAAAIDEVGRIIPEQLQYLNEEKAKTLKIGRIENGDILLSHNASVGKVAHYRGEFGPALIGTSLTCFRPNRDAFTPDFLFLALKSARFQSQLTANMSQTTRNQVPITAQRRIKIVRPSLARQSSVSQALGEVEREHAACEASMQSFNRLFASLQHRAFQGEL